MKDDLVRTWMEVELTYTKVLLKHLPARTETINTKMTIRTADLWIINRILYLPKIGNDGPHSSDIWYNETGFGIVDKI